MRTVRVIPCLDVDAGRVVKGVHFRNLRDIGLETVKHSKTAAAALRQWCSPTALQASSSQGIVLRSHLVARRQMAVLRTPDYARHPNRYQPL